jgi:hypothetical protein
MGSKWGSANLLGDWPNAPFWGDWPNAPFRGDWRIPGIGAPSENWRFFEPKKYVLFLSPLLNERMGSDLYRYVALLTIYLPI